MGDYTGEVPGTSGLCAKVASDCNNPDIMFYSVSSCENRSHVYEGKCVCVSVKTFKFIYRFRNVKGLVEFKCCSCFTIEHLICSFSTKKKIYIYSSRMFFILFRSSRK